MKKTLLISILVLAIITSIVAGTTAVYTVDLGNIAEGSVVAKEFIFTGTGNGSFSDTVKIAPTETVTKQFSIANHDSVTTSEVKLDVTVDVVVSETLGKLSIENLTAVVKDTNGNTISTGNLVKGIGTLSFNCYFDLTAEEKTYYIVISWPSNDNDIDFAGSGFGNTITVNASAVQCTHDSHDENNGNDDENDQNNTYLNTNLVIQDNIWPRQEDFASSWDTITINPSGIFRYTDSELYVINTSVPISKSQSASGPGGTAYNWYITQKLTGNIIIFNAGETEKTVVRGDLCYFSNEYYVFKDGGTVGTTPLLNPDQWYKLPQ